MNRIVCSLSCLLLVFSALSTAQTKPNPAGRWEGSISVPTGGLKIVVDIDRDAKGAWIGDIDIPDQGVKDLPLKAVAVSGDSVSFEMSSDPAGPKFQGKLSADGNTLDGNFSQGGNSVPLSLKRSGEAKVIVELKNAELPEKFAGKWEGSLDAMGTTLRLAFNLENKDGSANGTIDSLDQGANGIPMNQISTAENDIKITAKMVGGSYTGKLSEDGKVLTGEWSQAGTTLPLVLKKAAVAK